MDDLSTVRFALATFLGDRAGSPLHHAMVARISDPDESERKVAREHGVHQTTLRRAMAKFRHRLRSAVKHERGGDDD